MYRKFEEWIKKSGYKRKHIAEQVGVSYQVFHRITTGRVAPSRPVAILIKQFTGGEIDFIGKE